MHVTANVPGVLGVTGHILIIGETQSGKTFYANHLHREFATRGHGLSIFWNTNHIPYVWGEKVQSVNGLAAVAQRSKAINFLPSGNLEQANQQLAQLVAWIFKHGKGAGRVWCQVLVDEAQEYSRENSQNDPVRMVATRGLGAYGVRLIAITQYPVTLNTTTRTNCAFRVIFKPGIEGTRFLQSYGQYPVEELGVWTAKKYHFMSYAPNRGWAQHGPI